ncbi:hypothetical protein [Streptomyces fuscichromogenes]|uniref:Uncharacterized protein n=1 Tax=Streptomyces fuscichromogenes TaxID=1324013 RepID=A0A917X8D9_9ACTN|nr:hypothetical protein [Streptomyces fuscichromogenes]GGM89263.1 hypothetical protein GCM10011578_006120 [Streptomyces fuscichromogenes]
MKLGKALATGVAEERPLVHDEVPEVPEVPEVRTVPEVSAVPEVRGLREEIHESRAPGTASQSLSASASEEAPAAR